jgi:hypothetical protein
MPFLCEMLNEHIINKKIVVYCSSEVTRHMPHKNVLTCAHQVIFVPLGTRETCGLMALRMAEDLPGHAKTFV